MHSVGKMCQLQTQVHMMLDAFSKCHLYTHGHGIWNVHEKVGVQLKSADMCRGKRGWGQGGLQRGDFAGKNLRVGPLVDGNIHAFSICS